ncbi:arylsulfatase activity protein [[Candida] boidinii]|nr:arylsulfatase activity protein [[Candida] boidinii]
MTVKKPNFIVIVADDLGFTDLSAFGGEIDTPNLNKLAQNGLRFTDFHTASACSPTRSMLFSGTDNHIAGLGQMHEAARNFPDLFEGKPGYEGSLNFRVAALPEILNDNGYYTFLSGKWHLGLTEKYWPSKRGFEKSFSLLPGAGNHYKYFPKDENSQAPVTFMAPLFQENDSKLDPYDDLPEDYYSSNYFTEKFLNFYNDDTQRKDRPFFGCLTFTAPHWPFQAPPEVIAKYDHVYDDGPIELRKRRLDNAIKLGLVPENVEPHKLTTKRDKTWDELSDEEKKTESKIMQIYAAMVDILDQNIGLLIKDLEAKNELDNTFILFMSDNGAEGMLIEALPVMNESFQTNIEKFFNNSYDNLGKKDSFAWYSDLWAQAATSPSSMYKAWTTEGGIRCPLIVHYPDLIKQPSTINDQFLTVMDILPTILDIANIDQPKDVFQDRKIVKIKGKSFKTYLSQGDESPLVHDENSVTGWELFSQQAIRKGEYKALFIPRPLGPHKWQLFNLKKDPGEIYDLAESEKDKLNELIDHWTEYVAETGLVECTDTFYDFFNAQYKPRPIE